MKHGTTGLVTGVFTGVTVLAILFGLVVTTIFAAVVQAAESGDSSDDDGLAAFGEAARAEPLSAGPPLAGSSSDGAIFHGREYLVPALAEDPLAIGDGPRPFLDRISFSPAWGKLGTERLFTMRAAFHPNSWLGWEAGVGHNPGESVHALLHTLNAVLRWPIPWRVQPYGSAGYGMMLVFPGESFNADPVTKNALTAGGGLEFYVRDDVALRFDARHLALLDADPNDSAVALRYGEYTIGLAFYRGLRR